MPDSPAQSCKNQAVLHSDLPMKRLRELQSSDHAELLEVYRLAVESCSGQLYTSQQRLAWALQAGDAANSLPPHPQLLACLQRGRGLVSCQQDGQIAAFAIRDPADRLALLYCRPCDQGRGHGSALLEAVEQEARQQGLQRLTTEASLISQPLLERRGWQRSWREELMINGSLFHRYRLHKPLQPILA